MLSLQSLLAELVISLESDQAKESFILGLLSWLSASNLIKQRSPDFEPTELAIRLESDQAKES